MTIREKIRLIAVLLIICFAALVYVGITARTSEIQYSINSINKEIVSMDREVKNLEVKIKSSSNINNLEHRALEMGMVYPTFDQIRYIRADAAAMKDFAMTLKTAAYSK